MEVYKLSKPLVFDGETYHEIKMDFDSLSVIDLERCERQARTLFSKKETMLTPALNQKYQSCVAARAAGMPIDAIRSLSARDYTQVCLEVQNFLLGGDSDEDEESTAEDSPSAQEVSGKTPTHLTSSTKDTPELKTQGSGSFTNQ